jgi:hypothetical protein
MPCPTPACAGVFLSVSGIVMVVLRISVAHAFQHPLIPGELFGFSTDANPYSKADNSRKKSC